MKGKNKLISKKYNREILGIIIVAFGVLSTISLFSDKTGIIGIFLKNIYLTLMGFGGYIFPLIIIVIGGLFIVNRLNSNEFIKSVYLLIMFLCLLTLLDIRNQGDIDFSIRVKQSLSLGQEELAGGFIGVIFGSLFYKLFGSVGSYIILLLINFVSILLFTETRIKDILTYIINRIRGIKNKRIKNGNSNRIQDEESVLKRKIEKPLKSRNIIIHDYNEKRVKNAMNQRKERPSEKAITNLYVPPNLDLLDDYEKVHDAHNKKNILHNAKRIEETMKNFNIDAKISQINKGPTVTCYELQPAPGVKVSKIINLSADLALNLATSDIRIEAPIPGKSAVGIEVPNKIKDSVSLKEMLKSDEYAKLDSDLPLLLGKDISGNSIISAIDRMPHLLIAGATGSGKSVCINSIIMGILFKSSPEKVKFILIDPKVVELSVYNDIPHLLTPVITEPKESASALSWAVKEMERRYKLFAKRNVKDSNSYNNKIKNTEETLPYIVIIIDELADLMMVAAQEIEDYISRLAQMSRAAGIYLIIATQRPSVDVITGTIKANIPSRISFAVSSQVDSRTILDISGAEKLLRRGDMLFYPSSLPKPIRIQGAFISDKEVEKVVSYIKEQNTAEYDKRAIESIKEDMKIESITEDLDDLFMDAVDLVIQEGQASISLLQRRLKIGYARAARIIDSMEERNIIGGFEGSKPRKVLITKDQVDSLFKERT
ncbi:MAG TPA: DNA translocase FtsK [Tepidimicrobium sp.]|nr:DNA translocase FtsK [Tepidimicrobium sp.]